MDRTNEAILNDLDQTDPGLERLRTANEAKRTAEAVANEANEATITIKRPMKPRTAEAVASLAVYVPSTTRGQTKIPQSEFSQRTDRIILLMVDLFGGSTVLPAIGYWRNEAGIMINERINIVRSATDPITLADHYQTVVDTMITNGRSWYQDVIGLELNGSFIMIDLT